MIKNILQFIYNLDGSLIDKNLSSVRAHSNYTNIIQIIAPWPSSDSISAEYVLYNIPIKKLQDYSTLAKKANGEALLGRDVIDSGKAYYQTVKDWHVWEIQVGKKALSGVSKNHAGKFGVAFTIKENQTSAIATNYKGTFGSIKSTTKGDIPASSTQGSFYKCDLINYESIVANETFRYNEVVVWNEGSWVKGSLYTLRFNLATQDIPVDPSMESIPAEELDYDLTEQVLDTIAGHTSNLTDLTTRTIGLENLTQEHVLDISNLEAIVENQINNVTYTPSNGHLTFYKQDGTNFHLDLPLELIVSSGYYDDELQKIVLVLANNDEIKIPVGDILRGVATEIYVDEQITDRQAIVKVNQTSLNETDLIYFMQTLEDGMYRIKTDLWGHEFLFISDMNLPIDPDAEVPELALVKEYARYTANGTSYRYDFELNDWILSAGGGSGGGGGGEVVTIQLTPVPLNFPLNFSHALGTDLSVTVNFTHSELQFATLRILRGTTEVEVRGVNLGENVIDLTPHIRAGSNSITLRVTDGERSRSISYNITGVAIALTSTFNDAVTYGTNVDIPFRVQTEAQKKVYFTVDGVTETLTNVQLNNIKSLTGLTHGVKEVEIQAAALIGEQEILSNKLRFNVIVSTQSSPALISSKFEIAEVTRGSLISIDYIIYNPVLEFNETVLKVDGEIVGTLTVGRQRQFWNIKNLQVGLRTLRIEAAGVFKEFQITILPLDIDFENVEDSFLKLYLSAAGKSNSDIEKLTWENSFGSPLTTNLSGFNFASNGWIDDALVFNGNATISIPFKPFQNVVPQVGKTIELEFETTEGLADEFIRCMHNNRGFIVYKDRAFLRSSNTQVQVFFKENEKIKLSFVINPIAGYTLTYINGVMTGIDRMNAQTSFQQSTAQNIIVNDKAVDGKLYNVRVYDRALEHQEILQNYLYDIVSLEDKILEYNFSDIFNQSGTPDIEKVKERIPVMTIRTYTSDEFGNRLPQTESFRPFVSAYFEHPTNPDKNFSLPNVRIRTQGTSTLQYPVKNYRLYQGDLDLNPMVFNDEMHPAVRINLKADYMESSMSTDPALALLFNTMYTKPTPPKAIDGLSRTTIWSEGAIALFHDDGQTVRFEGIYNFNGDKGDNKQWGFYPELPFPESDMRRFEILFNASNHAVAFVKNPLLTEQEWLNQLYEGFEPRYPYDASGNEIYTPEQYAQLKDFIEFISDADLDTPEGIVAFKNEFEQRAELEYFTKYLISIFIFGMVDNFGKDLLLNTWGNEGGLYPKWYVVLYDMDSAAGIDNQGFMTDSEGNLLFDYNIEMEDEGVFAQASSKLWDAIVVAYPDTLKSTYATLRGSVYTWDNIWKYLYTDQIAKISKGMYNANAITKYIETPGSEAWLWMLNGDRVNQMSRWITNRLAYLDSKYDYNTDEKSITARFDIADTDGFNIQVKTSIHQWVSGQLGNTTAGTMKTRTLLGEVATLNHTYTNGTELPFVEFELFNGQYITELVNMKDLPVRTLQIPQAEQLKVLDLSKVTPSSQLQSVSFGNNFELTEVNLQNNTGLGGLLDLSGAIKLKKLDLRGTAITSIVLPNGGVLEELYLPNTITSLEIRNQAYLQTISLAEGTELEILILENTPVDYRDLFPYLGEDGKVRILGIEMSAYGEDYLLSIQTDLTGIGGIDSFGNYTEKPFMQGIIKILDTVNIDLDLLNWFAINLPDLIVEVNVILDGLQFTDYEDYIALTGYTQNTTGLIAIPTAINADLTPENNIIFGIDGWKPVTKIANAVLSNKVFTSIQLPNQLQEIGASAFQGANQFTEIFIPETVTIIGANAFAGNNAGLVILAEPDEKPAGWNIDWNSGNSTVIWGVRSTPTLFTFNTKGGDSVQSISARYLTSLLTPTKFGYNSNGWFYNSAEVTFPFAPLKTDPLTLEIEVGTWTPWEYEARFKLPDNTVHETIYVTYGDILGSEFVDIDKGGSNEPTYGAQIFRGWYTSSGGGTKLTSSYVINQDALADGYIVEFYGQFLDTQGLVFTYQAGDDVYDVTGFSLTSTSMANGSINLFVPATFDNGTNGEKPVRNVNLNSSNAGHRDKIGSITVEDGVSGIFKLHNYSSHMSNAMSYVTYIEIPSTMTIENLWGAGIILGNPPTVGTPVVLNYDMPALSTFELDALVASAVTEIRINSEKLTISASTPNMIGLTKVILSDNVKQITMTTDGTTFMQYVNPFIFEIEEGNTFFKTTNGGKILYGNTLSPASPEFKALFISAPVINEDIIIPSELTDLRFKYSFTNADIYTNSVLNPMSINNIVIHSGVTLPTSIPNALDQYTLFLSSHFKPKSYQLATTSSIYTIYDNAIYNSNKTNLIALGRNSTSIDFSNLTTISDSSCSHAGWTSSDLVIPSGVSFGVSNKFNLFKKIIINSSFNIGNFSLKESPNLEEVVFNGIYSGTRFGNSAFQDCTSLTTISLPTDSNLVEIPSNTFYGCSSLTSITIPSNFTTIKNSAFYGCSSLTSITIPSNVTSIGNYAFRDCSSLLSVNLLPTTPPTLSNANAFQNNATGRTFYIPKNTYNAYSTATNWSTYASDMEEVI